MNNADNTNKFTPQVDIASYKQLDYTPEPIDDLGPSFINPTNLSKINPISYSKTLNYIQAYSATQVVKYIVLFRFTNLKNKLVKTDLLFKNINAVTLERINLNFSNTLNEQIIKSLYELSDKEFEVNVKKFIALQLLFDTYKSFNKSSKSSLQKSIKKGVRFKWTPKS